MILNKKREIEKEKSRGDSRKVYTIGNLREQKIIKEWQFEQKPRQREDCVTKRLENVVSNVGRSNAYVVLNVGRCHAFGILSKCECVHAATAAGISNEPVRAGTATGERDCWGAVTSLVRRHLRHAMRMLQHKKCVNDFEGKNKIVTALHCTKRE